MKYYSDQGLKEIPSDINKLYEIVREIGARHGYDPTKSGLVRDLFIYTPFEIKTMVTETWSQFGYTTCNSKNKYFKKLRVIKDNIDDMNPVLLNIAGGDYKGHTVTVVGYRVFGKDYHADRTFVKIYDGWSEAERYIDWFTFGCTLANVTKII